jgi:hypothetical protein
MLAGDQGTQVGGAKLRPAPVAVRSQGLRAPELEPVTQFGLVFEGGEQHLLVVPQQRHHGTALGEGDHLLQHAPAVRPPVDVVAQEHQGVRCPGADVPDQGSQRRRAAVPLHQDKPGGVGVFCPGGENLGLIHFLLFNCIFISQTLAG